MYETAMEWRKAARVGPLLALLGSSERPVRFLRVAVLRHRLWSFGMLLSSHENIYLRLLGGSLFAFSSVTNFSLWVGGVGGGDLLAQSSSYR